MFVFHAFHCIAQLTAVKFCALGNQGDWVHRVIELSCVFFRRRVRNFGTELWEFASIFVLRNGIPSYFLFRRRVRNGIPRFSVPRYNRNSVGNNHLFRLFRLPRNYFFAGNSQPYLCCGFLVANKLFYTFICKFRGAVCSRIPVPAGPLWE